MSTLRRQRVVPKSPDAFEECNVISRLVLTIVISDWDIIPPEGGEGVRSQDPECHRKSRQLCVGCSLENEAAVQLYMNPIAETIISLFCGPLTNIPQHMFHGRIAGNGRCKCTITFHGRLTLLFIELKQSLAHDAHEHSKIVAQVMAEADGANLFNEEYRFDGIPIRAILTDGIEFEFEFFLISKHGLFNEE